MATCFRIRFLLGDRTRIASPEPELPIPDRREGKRILLKAAGGVETLGDAEHLALLGRPFDNDQQALDAAQRWVGVLQKAFAHVYIGADFGSRAPQGGATALGLRFLEETTGERMLNDVHGISIYECDPEPRFARAEAKAVVGRNADRVTKAIERALEVGAVMDGSEQLAYDLYAASFSESAPDARFMMLMMALETLIEPLPRSTHVRTHIDGLIASTRKADLPRKEADSIIGSLRWLRDESISQAGRKLAGKLGDRVYMEDAESATVFFTECYRLRSALAHGHDPRPSRDTIGTRAASLEQFVGDLLSLEL